MSKARSGWTRKDNPRLPSPEDEWRQCKGVYRYFVYLTPEEKGDFSVVAARLPGVASQGNTEQEALANIVEAFKSAIAHYKEQGVDVPWTKTPIEPPRGSVTRVVIVRS